MWSQLEYTAQVQDCVVLGDGATLVVAVRGSNCLRVLRLDDLQVRLCCVWQACLCGGVGCCTALSDQAGRWGEADWNPM